MTLGSVPTHSPYPSHREISTGDGNGRVELEDGVKGTYGEVKGRSVTRHEPQD